MPETSLFDIAATYFHRFGYKPRLIREALPADTRMIVVIPCYDEPALTATLQSLAASKPTQYPVEVIVVINAGEKASPEVHAQNMLSRKKAEQWIAAKHRLPFSCHLLQADELPAKHAGVGLARKIGMDEALRRFASIDYAGLIVCLDADCLVADNYLQETEKVFLAAMPHACNIYFEHDLQLIEDTALRQGIIYYELFLRYYVNALRYSGFPFAIHTIGSSMAVRADIYARTGGMNRRKAGEDFYFLHKVAPQGHFLHIQNTAVYPSARISHRVPFGTGKAQANWKKQALNTMNTYHFQIFQELQVFLQQLSLLAVAGKEQQKTMEEKIPAAVLAFLQQQNFNLRLEEIHRHTTSQQAFIKRFFQWFNGFTVLKYVHFARDYFYPSVPLTDAAQQLLAASSKSCRKDATELLMQYRLLDRQWPDSMLFDGPYHHLLL